MGTNNPLHTPSSEPSRYKRLECPSSPQPRPYTDPSRLKRQDCPSSTQSQPGPANVLGTSENPVTITTDEVDKKPIMDPLSRLRPLRLPNKKQLISQNNSEESQIVIKQMKKLLVSEFFSPNINMDINTMIDRANGVLDTLAFLQDDDMPFYDAVCSYIYWYHEWVIADGLRNGLCKKIIDRGEMLESELKNAEESVKSAEHNLLVEKNTVVSIREKIRNLEQELVKSEARVIVLAVEKDKCEQIRNGVKDELIIGIAKAKESAEVLKKIDDRRKEAINKTSEMRNVLKPYSI